VMSVSEMLYSQRKAVHQRPQDQQKMTAKQEGRTKSKLEQKIELFINLEERRTQLYAFKSTGVKEVRVKGDIMLPQYDGLEKAGLEMKLTPEEKAELAKTVKFANSPAPPRKMAM